MKEIEFINTIKNIIGNNLIGDDCAYLKELGIVVTQDSLVENVHFRTDWCSPYQLGYKSIAVNISDILASGGKPEYVFISLSLPKSIDTDFIKDFYEGASSSLFGAKIAGGDITGAENNIFITVTAIGSTGGRNISSRKNAKEGYVVVTKGNHGSSSLGLKELLKGGKNEEIIKAHLEPQLEFNFAQTISSKVQEDYAMMDTSDGLGDALFKIAEASKVKIIADYDKIPHLKSSTPSDVLFGGEDYKPVAAIPEKYLTLVPDAAVIGHVVPYDGIRLEISGHEYKIYDELKVFDHFNNRK